MDTFSENDAHPNPFIQFKHWYDQALDDPDIVEPTAMTVATVTTEGKPTARVILLKHFDEHGFAFFTNYHSRKGEEISKTPWVCLNFWWGKLAKQIRIEGSIEKSTPEASDEYFQSRPRGSQLGAWASDQSQVITDRQALEEKLQHVTQQYGDQTVPCPPHWGGYLVKPNLFEFWQGRENRLHDRLRYQLQNDQWHIDRLSP